MTDSKLIQDVNNFCKKIGLDELLVQGAGGNVSWKDNDKTLWIKASGTWLADACISNIFVPVDLTGLLDNVASGNFNAKPAMLFHSDLRPSIETVLHALMPQKIVVHLHAVEVLAHLVRCDCERQLKDLLAPMFDFEVVPYLKPGAELAEAVSRCLVQNPTCNIIFLKNHGVVIGAESIAKVEELLYGLTKVLKQAPREIKNAPQGVNTNIDINGKLFARVDDPKINQLAVDPINFRYLESAWALCPDHVVFLGAKPHVLEGEFSSISTSERADFYFVKGMGVYLSDKLSEVKVAQLRCYYDVLSRQAENQRLVVLDQKNIDALMNWDAEKYRKNLEK